MSTNTRNDSGDTSSEERTGEVDESKNIIAVGKELPPVVVIAGKAGSGKSTLLQNIFNVDTESGMGTDGVTKEITKKYAKCNGAEMIVYDTPGLGDSSIPYEKLIRKKMHPLTTHEDYIFLYTLRANPGSRVDQFDDEIIKTLSDFLGEQIWNKCILLLTFSDTTWREKYERNNDKDGYKKYLEDMTLAFQSKLKKYKPRVIIKTIFELEANIYDEPPTLSRKQDIVAIPTACFVEYDSNMLLPDIVLTEGHDWTDVVFAALMRLVPAEKRKAYGAYKYYLKRLPVAAGACAGLVIGTAIGGVAGGRIIGPRTAMIGAAAGSTIGSAVAEKFGHN